MKNCTNEECNLRSYPLTDKKNYCNTCGGKLEDLLSCICGEDELRASSNFCGACGLSRDAIEKELAEQRHFDNIEAEATGN